LHVYYYMWVEEIWVSIQTLGYYYFKLKIIIFTIMIYFIGGGNQMMNMNQNPGPVNATTCKKLKLNIIK